MPRTSLVELRRQLARVDATLQRAVARRLQLADRVGEVKRLRGVPFRQPAQERKVVARWRAGLAAEGVPPDRAEAMARWLIDESLRAQTTRPASRVRRPLEIAVVGGAGAMGQWLVAYLRDRGHRVRIVDPRASRGRPSHPTPPIRLSDALERSDVVILATPIRAAAGVYREAVRRGTRALLLDILSVKDPILGWLARARKAGLHVASLHPMFGPSGPSETHRTVLVLDCGDSVARRSAERLLAGASIRLVPWRIDDHDRLMAELQALPRLTSLAFWSALDRPLGLLERVAPPSFDRQLMVTRSTLAEPARLRRDLLSANPHTRGAIARLRGALDHVEAGLGKAGPRPPRARRRAGRSVSAV